MSDFNKADYWFDGAEYDLNLCGLSAEMSEEQLDLLDMLSPLNIEARYPLQKDRLLASLTVSRCEQMIQETEVLYQWIRKKC